MSERVREEVEYLGELERTNPQAKCVILVIVIPPVNFDLIFV